MNTPNYSQPATQRPRRSKLPVIMGIVGVLSCILSVAVLLGYFFLFPKDAAARPLVLIHAPHHGDQFEVGQTATVHATARDENNITRLELWVNGDLVEVETSALSEGISPFPILANWQPQSAGTHTLTVRAFNSLGTRTHSSITVEAIELPDRDGDGVADEIDACPDEANPTPDGCPLGDDRDGDGVPDAEDACPDEAGWADHDGCPTPGDSDGDGVPDEEDACPDEHGLPDLEGCPDRDADSVPDHLDADPDEPGPAESDGAPDADGAPEEPEVPEGGDPGLDIPDSDGDGASDDVDPCPDEYGEPEDGYCPPPEDDPVEDEDDPFFDFGDIPGFGMDTEIPVNVEVEAYEFSVSGEHSENYSNVWCYVQIAGGEMHRYEFEPQGDRFWDIGAVLGGDHSVHLATVLSERLPVFVDCGSDILYTYTEEGDDEGPGDAGGWGTIFDLGTHEYAHDSLEWDGRELLASGIGPDGEAFQAKYRICVPSCDETDFQAPILAPITLGPRGEGPFNVRWRWDGTEEWITGFKLYVNGALVDIIDPGVRSLDIGAYQPSCGEIMEFEMTAFTELDDAPDRESPRSNTRVWDGLTCPRTVMVTFLSFDTSALGSRQGPISGTFYANDVSLIAEYRDGPPSFDATDDTERYLSPGHVYNIATLFSDIEREAWSCIGGGCTRNYAPSVNYLEVELSPREALTFGANIWKEGGGRAFEGSAYIPAGDIVPGEYVIYDNGINMHVLIDVLVGPEAGGSEHLPDLTISDVTAHEESGQLRIHVFNNASDLVDEDISVNLVRMSTNEQIGVYTWENVTIPSGSMQILQSGTLTLEPYDLRAIVDPDNVIDETDAGNNIYETPVLIRVEFLRAFAPHCNETGCSIFDCDSEHVFQVWAGYGPARSDVEWVGYNVRFPEHGEIRYCGRDPCDRDEDWSMAGNDRYTFEFEMPASDNLYVMVTGDEQDGPTNPDSLGVAQGEYMREMNYGADNTYDVSHGRETPCDDAFCIPCHEGLTAWWRITRVR